MKLIKKLRPNRALILNKLLCDHLGVFPFGDVEIEDGYDGDGAYLKVRMVARNDTDTTEGM